MAIKRIFKESLRSKIQMLQDELLREENEYQYDIYLKNVFEEVNKQFERYLKDDYLFARAYYLPLEKNPQLSIVPISSRNKANHIFYDGIIEAEKMVKNKKACSLAEYVVTKNILGVLLYKSVKPFNEIEDVPPLFTVHRYENPNNAFAKIDKDLKLNTSNMVSHHNKMAVASGYNELFSYVLRTRNLDKYFNGTLYLVLKRKLEIDEYREIIDYFTFTMQARILLENRPLFQNQEWKKVIEQFTHSTFNQRAVLNDYSKEFAETLKKKKLNDLSEQFKTMEILRTSIDIVFNFFYALNKVEFSRENYFTLQNPRVKEVLKLVTVNLGVVLEGQIEFVEKSVDVIPFNKREHKINVRKYLEKFKHEILIKYKNIDFTVALSGAENIFLDMLKNAVRYTDDVTPKVHIDLYPFIEKEIDEWQLSRNDFTALEGEYMTLAISNNSPIVYLSKGKIDRKDYDNILGKVFSDKTSNASQLGIRIIKTIIKYDGLGASGKPWFYTPSKECLKGRHTKILLLIPKSDFNHGI